MWKMKDDLQLWIVQPQQPAGKCNSMSPQEGVFQEEDGSRNAEVH